MKSRMEKYYSDESSIPKRTSKNGELYDKINEKSLDNISITPNISVLEEEAKNIDVDKIKQILDKRYDNTPKRRSIVLDDIEEETEYEENVPDTKEYDINTILSKAREEQKPNYENERLRKLRDTQFDILNSLDLDKEEVVEPVSDETEEQKLVNLINTITELELKNTKIKDGLDPLDILTDLKGSGNTEVLDGVVEEVKDNNIDKENSFYTESMKLKNEDFDDFDELSKEVKSNSAVTTILIVIIILGLLCGLLFLINNVFDLGLF